MMILCKIVRISNTAENIYTYGLKLHYLKNVDSDRLNAFMLNKQLLERFE